MTLTVINSYLFKLSLYFTYFIFYNPIIPIILSKITLKM